MARLRAVAFLAGFAALSGCSLAPHYQVPDVPVAARYQSSTSWTVAAPADRLDRSGWWKLYREPRLDELEAQLIAHNHDLRAAYYHYVQSQAFVRQASSQFYPQVSAGGEAQRERESDTRPLRNATAPTDFNAATLGAEVDYEVDLWGRVRDSVAASKEESEAEKDDLASIQLSLEVELARTWLDLRGDDQQIKLLEDTIDAYRKALDLTRKRHDGGVASALDVARASTQLSFVRSDLTQVQAKRALLEHAIAVLVGASASDFALAPGVGPVPLPAIPAGVPAELLQRRPDVAAAERRVAAANSKIGVARSAYFPSLTLSAQGGFQSSVYSDLLGLPSSYWALGPALAVYLFDGGKRRAQVQSAEAATAEAGERYRSVVLASFRQVEDDLTLLAQLGIATTEQQQAVDAADLSVDLALSRYRRGAVSYLEVVDAQTAALAAKRGEIEIRTRQLDANVDLVRALGGGWRVDDVDSVKTTPMASAP
ncbi:efflux transporter outer membrane subunit [Paraburkholderia sp. SOS3]|uniref:efflux transporter outer membrane subunit n=1 Tax=Paraburkholderia sp. SOS3 TaxID=1926494 RepID=UPI00094760A6|nr:efflux transporter outer membrane subunit [Paraburkholderia sp. SOS3]APR39396.1 RND transporter [Paraburkholderia sp. SOS3]